MVLDLWNNELDLSQLEVVATSIRLKELILRRCHLTTLPSRSVRVVVSINYLYFSYIFLVLLCGQKLMRHKQH